MAQLFQKQVVRLGKCLSRIHNGTLPSRYFPQRINSILGSTRITSFSAVAGEREKEIHFKLNDGCFFLLELRRSDHRPFLWGRMQRGDRAAFDPE